MLPRVANAAEVTESDVNVTTPDGAIEPDQSEGFGALHGDQHLEAPVAGKIEQNARVMRVVFDDEQDRIAGREVVAVVFDLLTAVYVTFCGMIVITWVQIIKSGIMLLCGTLLAVLELRRTDFSFNSLFAQAVGCADRRLRNSRG